MKQSEKYGFPIYEDEDNVELDKYTEELTEKLEDLEDTDREEINNIYKDVQASKIYYKTEQAKSLYIDDATDSRGKISVEGNVEQEVTETSPSIDYPSPIKCLGSNKNELHMQEKETTQIGVIVKQQESILTLNGTTNAIGNLLNGNYVDIGTFKKGKYSFKVHISGNFERPSGSDFAFYIRKKSDTSKSYGVITGSTIGRNSFIFELTEDTDLVIQMFANASNIVFDNFEMKLKLEEGETATSYSPYRTR